MAAGEAFDLTANVTTDEEGFNNFFELFLMDDEDEVVARAADDSNEGLNAEGKPNDDNLSLTLLYKEKVSKDTTFKLYAKAIHETHTVPAHQLQIGYKTYGSGHAFN